MPGIPSCARTGISLVGFITFVASHFWSSFFLLQMNVGTDVQIIVIKIEQPV